MKRPSTLAKTADHNNDIILQSTAMIEYLTRCLTVLGSIAQQPLSDEGKGSFSEIECIRTYDRMIIQARKVLLDPITKSTTTPSLEPSVDTATQRSVDEVATLLAATFIGAKFPHVWVSISDKDLMLLSGQHDIDVAFKNAMIKALKHVGAHIQKRTAGDRLTITWFNEAETKPPTKTIEFDSLISRLNFKNMTNQLAQKLQKELEVFLIRF